MSEMLLLIIMLRYISMPISSGKGSSSFQVLRLHSPLDSRPDYIITLNFYAANQHKGQGGTTNVFGMDTCRGSTLLQMGSGAQISLSPSQLATAETPSRAFQAEHRTDLTHLQEMLPLSLLV